MKLSYKQIINICVATLFFLPFRGLSQCPEKVSYKLPDNTNGYYLAIPPNSNNIKAVLVLLCSFKNPESLLPETKLHNVASGNDLLTVYASMGMKIYADTVSADRIKQIKKQCRKEKQKLYKKTD